LNVSSQNARVHTSKADDVIRGKNSKKKENNSALRVRERETLLALVARIINLIVNLISENPYDRQEGLDTHL